MQFFEKYFPQIDSIQLFTFPGVCLSHAALVSSMESFDVLTSDDISFNTSSIYWISGLGNLLVGTFYGATRIITAAPVSTEKYLSIIENYKVTSVIFGSARLSSTLKNEAFLKTNFESLKHIFLGGAVVPLFASSKFNSQLPNGNANNCYGCTEFGGIFTIDFPKFSQTDTVGRLPSGYAFKIIDDDGNRRGIEEDGEICTKCPFKFLGYYKDESLTEKTMDNEGFFHTGDIGRVDKNGNLYIVGRKKDLMSYPCYISPHEIEELLIKSPDIEIVCVVPVQCEVGNEFPAAVIVLTENSKITEDDVFKIVAGDFSKHLD